MSTYEVVIVGGGLIGLAAAYHLARRGAAVLLLEASSLGSGTSGACAGRAQVSESHRGTHLDFVLAGLARLEHLSDELGFDVEWRRLGNLMLIEREEHWQWWTDQVAYLKARRVPAEMMDRQSLGEAEPLLQVDKFRGAAWCLEGHLNPLKLCHAFGRAARQAGATLLEEMPVTGFKRQGERLTTICTPKGHFGANKILVAAGAWTGEVLRQAGVNLPICFTHAEAMITEPLPPLLYHHVGLADFYDTIHNQAQAVSIGVAQQKTGALLITEAVEMSPTIDRRNTIWGVPGMAHDLLGLFPKLAGVRIRRSWAAPSPFLPDEHPAIGWLPGLDNLFVATCFHLTITTLPILSDLMAGLILGETGQLSLAEFDPTRFLGNRQN
jgi:D-hydroxyproline dehydrogenase subunit beta